MDSVTLSVEFLAGIIIGVVVPTFIWALKMYSMTKHLRDMVLDPDEHGFGSTECRDLIVASSEAQLSLQQEYINSNKALRYAIKELAHFTRWMAKERTGKEPPPFVRSASD